MALAVEVEREQDGRWLAEVLSIPGALAYGADRAEAVSRAQAIALRALADMLENAELAPQVGDIFMITS